MLRKLSKSEINRRVNAIAALIRPFNPDLADDYINKPLHRDMNIHAFEAGFGFKPNANSTEIVLLHMELQGDIQFGVFVVEK